MEDFGRACGFDNFRGSVSLIRIDPSFFSISGACRIEIIEDGLIRTGILGGEVWVDSKDGIRLAFL